VPNVGGVGSVGASSVLVNASAMLSKVYGFVGMLDFKAAVAAMSPADLDAVLASAKQYDEATEEAMPSVELEEVSKGSSDRLLDLIA